MRRFAYLTPAVELVASWMAKSKTSWPKACTLINAAYEKRTGHEGKLDRGGLWRFMAGKRTPNVDYAAAIKTVTKVPIEMWTRAPRRAAA